MQTAPQLSDNSTADSAVDNSTADSRSHRSHEMQSARHMSCMANTTASAVGTTTQPEFEVVDPEATYGAEHSAHRLGCYEDKCAVDISTTSAAAANSVNTATATAIRANVTPRMVSSTSTPRHYYTSTAAAMSVNVIVDQARSTPTMRWPSVHRSISTPRHSRDGSLLSYSHLMAQAQLPPLQHQLLSASHVCASNPSSRNGEPNSMSENTADAIRNRIGNSNYNKSSSSSATIGLSDAVKENEHVCSCVGRVQDPPRTRMASVSTTSRNSPDQAGSVHPCGTLAHSCAPLTRPSLLDLLPSAMHAASLPEPPQQQQQQQHRSDGVVLESDMTHNENNNSNRDNSTNPDGKNSDDTNEKRSNDRCDYRTWCRDSIRQSGVTDCSSPSLHLEAIRSPSILASSSNNSSSNSSAPLSNPQAYRHAHTHAINTIGPITPDSITHAVPPAAAVPRCTRATITVPLMRDCGSTPRDEPQCCTPLLTNSECQSSQLGQVPPAPVPVEAHRHAAAGMSRSALERAVAELRVEVRVLHTTVQRAQDTYRTLHEGVYRSFAAAEQNQEMMANSMLRTLNATTARKNQLLRRLQRVEAERVTCEAQLSRTMSSIAELTAHLQREELHARRSVQTKLQRMQTQRKNLETALQAQSYSLHELEQLAESVESVNVSEACGNDEEKTASAEVHVGVAAAGVENKKQDREGGLHWMWRHGRVCGEDSHDGDDGKVSRDAASPQGSKKDDASSAVKNDGSNINIHTKESNHGNIKQQLECDRADELETTHAAEEDTPCSHGNSRKTQEMQNAANDAGHSEPGTREVSAIETKLPLASLVRDPCEMVRVLEREIAAVEHMRGEADAKAERYAQQKNRLERRLCRAEGLKQEQQSKVAQMQQLLHATVHAVHEVSSSRHFAREIASERQVNQIHGNGSLYGTSIASTARLSARESVSSSSNKNTPVMAHRRSSVSPPLLPVNSSGSAAAHAAAAAAAWATASAVTPRRTGGRLLCGPVGVRGHVAITPKRNSAVCVATKELLSNTNSNYTNSSCSDARGSREIHDRVRQTEYAKLADEAVLTEVATKISNDALPRYQLGQRSDDAVCGGAVERDSNETACHRSSDCGSYVGRSGGSSAHTTSQASSMHLDPFHAPHNVISVQETARLIEPRVLSSTDSARPKPFSNLLAHTPPPLLLGIDVINSAMHHVEQPL